MSIRSGALTEAEIVRLVDKYKREQLDKSQSNLDVLQEKRGGSFRDTRKVLTGFYDRKKDETTDTLLDLRGMEESTVYTAYSLLREQPPSDGVNVDSYSAEFKGLCRAVALANKEIFTALQQRNETGDSDYDRAERANPRGITLGTLIDLYQREKAAGWAAQNPSIAAFYTFSVTCRCRTLTGKPA